MEMTSNAPLWEQKLRSMVEYHTTNLAKGGTYAPYRHAMLENAVPNATATGALNDEAKSILKNHGAELISEHQTNVNTVQANLEKELKGDKSPDTPAWVAKFRDTGEKLKASSAKTIDRMTDKLIAATGMLPEKLREPTAEGWALIINKFTEFWRNVLAAVSVAINAVLNWIKEAWETVEAGFEKAGKFFKEAASWVVNLFS